MIFIVLPDIPAEDRLLDQARQGNQDAIRQIYEAYFSPIYQFIRMRVDDAYTAEDLSGNVFLKLIKACQERKAPHKSLRGWLFKVARNEVYDYFGKQQRLAETVLTEWIPAPNDQEPEVEFMRRLSIEQARYAIRQLSPEQQEVIVLRFGQLLNLQETADIMGKSVQAVKSLQFRAVNSLRQILMRRGVGNVE